MVQVALNLDVWRGNLERVPASIKFGEASADGNQEITFQQQLLRNSEAGDAAHGQGMVIGDCALAAGCGYDRRLENLRQLLHGRSRPGTYPRLRRDFARGLPLSR